MKPCPFCGGKATVKTSSNSVDHCGLFSQLHSVCCSKCGATTANTYKDEQKERECGTNKKKQIAYHLTAHHINAVEAVLSKGDRVELIPGPEGAVKILHIKRQVVKTGLEAEGLKN